MATIEQFPQRQTAAQERPYRTPPNNVDAEQALLGAILINNDAVSYTHLTLPTILRV